MQSDPMWSLAMAVNVYLVFFRRYDATRLKRLYWVYGIICYGIPFIPAMVCLLYKNQKGEIYGNATVRIPFHILTFSLTDLSALVLDRFFVGPITNLFLLCSHMGLYFSSHHYIRPGRH
jgi:hypothetical protein